VHNQAIAKRAGLVLGLLAASSLLFSLPVLAADQGVNITGVSGGFSPSPVSVDPGNTVTWTNRDPNAGHNAYCGGPPNCPVAMIINGGRAVSSGQSESFTFQYSGTYNYICSIHPSMKGQVVVSGDVQPPSSSGGGSSPGSGSGGGGSGGGTTAGTTAATPGSAGTTSSRTTTAKPASGGNTPASSASGAASDTVSTGQAVKDSLVGIDLRPNVVVKTRASGTAPWVLVATGAALVVSALLFGLAWFGPPIRLGRSR
jgi:plastocyanin